MRHARGAGFTLLPVILAMSLIAAIAFLLNRDNGVNARMIADRSDLDRARYAAEAGLQAVNFVVQGMGCGSFNYPTSGGPVTNNNFGGATYSAYTSRNKLLGGTPPPPLDFITSTGSYNGASVTLTRNNVYVYQSRATTTLQPGPTSGYDTYIDSNSSDRNFGGDTVLRLSNLDSPNSTYQPLLKFDLSIFPTGSRVIPWYDGTTLQPGANLALYMSSSGYLSSAVVNAQLITHSWVAGTGTGGSSPNGATWDTYDGNAINGHVWPTPRYAPVPVTSTQYPNAIGRVNWNLTNAVAAWLSGIPPGSIYPNYGIWLVGSGAAIGNTTYVSSNETSQTARRPMLALNYLLPCGTSVGGGGGGPSQTVTLAAAQDTYITADTTNAAYIKNNGADTSMYVGQVGTSPSLEQRMILKFDVSGIPPGSKLTSATLRLYVSQITGNSGATKTLDAYALTESWEEGFSDSSGNIRGASWTNRAYAVGWATYIWNVPNSGGGTYDVTHTYATGREESSGASPLPGSFNGGWVTWDLSALTQGWVDGVIVNDGILVKSRYPGDITYSVKLVTDENNSVGGTHRPQLVVVYQ